MTETTDRQVLYALVAGAWFVVVAVLAAVAGVVGLSPPWWTAAFAVVWLTAVVAGGRQWRRTGRLLLVSLAVFVVWAVGTLLTRPPG